MHAVLLRRAPKHWVFGALPLFLATSISAFGQPQIAPPDSTGEPNAIISVDTRLVVLHASVRSKRGRPVPGLRQTNFQVEEDGQPQVISMFHSEDGPVAAGLVIDNSGSMKNKRSDVNAAALAFARSSNPADEMFVVNFNEHVVFGLPDSHPFSASAGELEGALQRAVPDGETALYDAISAALAHLNKSDLERKVLIVISDGGDNASRRTLSHVLHEVEQSNTTIYAIGLYDEDDRERNPHVLQQLARASGGIAFLPHASAEAVSLCERIAKDIRTQYTIGYSPSNPLFDGSYRSIAVRATDGHGAPLLVRTRAGYVASPDDATATSGAGHR